jgi:hypothetical protein
MNLHTIMRAGLACAMVSAMAVATVASAGPVRAEIGPNLVRNGSFEDTSVIAGSQWAASGFIAEGFDYFIDLNPADAEQGTHSFAGGAIGGFGFISQSIPTIVGGNYNIHLWLANLSGFSDGTAFEVLWGGRIVYSATDILGFGYREIVIDPIANSATTVLSIGTRDDSFFLNVDNISVRQVVPEPATIALLFAGLAAAGLSRRRRSTM